jgi:hypothetical protein
VVSRHFDDLDAILEFDAFAPFFVVSFFKGLSLVNASTDAGCL